MTDLIERKHDRVEIDQSIVIKDMISGKVFGELVNVTVEGIMVITEKEIPTQSIYQLSLQLPFELCGSNSIIIGADCLWCRNVDNISRHWSGFHIIDASVTAMEQLQELITFYAK